jgi:NAD(P)-dependent dehydrogenase (short-subunit alcohol dehydrogenase family)
LRAKGSSERLDSDDLRSLLDLNVVSVHIVTVAVLRQSMLKNGGRIVNISSRDGNMGLPAVSFNMNATARSGTHRNLLIAAVDTTSRLFGTYTQPLSSLYLVSFIFLLISL